MKQGIKIQNLLNKLRVEAETLSIEELRQLHQLFTSREGESRVQAIMLENWEHSSAERDDKFELLLNRVEQRLQAKYFKRRLLVRFFRECAALLFFPLLGGMILLLLKITTRERPIEFAQVGLAEQEYISPIGMRSKITLQDSTVVWLNADSRLIVEAGFGAQQRTLRLIGEAYFEVKERADLTSFTVSTPEVAITVLGTTFNVSAYSDNRQVEAVLVEGSIEVASKKTKKFLKPAQRMTLQKANSDMKITEINYEDASLFTSWKDGKLVFRTTPLDEVARTLERWYNVSISLDDPVLKTYTYSGTFDNRSIEQIMKYIELSSPIRYTIEKEFITIYAKKYE